MLLTIQVLDILFIVLFSALFPFHFQYKISVPLFIPDFPISFLFNLFNDSFIYFFIFFIFSYQSLSYSNDGFDTVVIRFWFWFYLSCTTVSGSWIKDLFIYFIITPLESWGLGAWRGSWGAIYTGPQYLGGHVIYPTYVRHLAWIPPPYNVRKLESLETLWVGFRN